ncbi:unnamed protein product, partial [Linum tenue]
NQGKGVAKRMFGESPQLDDWYTTDSDSEDTAAAIREDGLEMGFDGKLTQNAHRYTSPRRRNANTAKRFDQLWWSKPWGKQFPTPMSPSASTRFGKRWEAFSKIGKPIRIDEATRTATRSDYARVCVQVDLTKPLLSQFSFNGETYYIQYEGLEKICLHCGTYSEKGTCTCNKMHEPMEADVVEKSAESKVKQPDQTYGEWMIAKRKPKRREIGGDDQHAITRTGKKNVAMPGGSRFEVLEVEEGNISQPEVEQVANISTTTRSTHLKGAELEKVNKQQELPKKTTPVSLIQNENQRVENRPSIALASTQAVEEGVKETQLTSPIKVGSTGDKIPSMAREQTELTAYELTASTVNNSHGRPVWRTIWRAPMMQRVCSFMWLLNHDRLFTNAERGRRHLTTDTGCKIFGAKPKTAIHVVRDCPFARAAWAELLGYKSDHRFFEEDLQRWTHYYLSGRSQVIDNTLFAGTCWLLWKNRNGFLFRSELKAYTQIQYQAKQLREQVLKALEKERSIFRDGGLHERRMVGWQPPAQDWVCINTYGSVISSPESTTCGGNGQGDDGRFISAFMTKLGGGSITRVELTSIVYGLKLAWGSRVQKGYSPDRFSNWHVLDRDRITAPSTLYASSGDPELVGSTMD